MAFSIARRISRYTRSFYFFTAIFAVLAGSIGIVQARPANPSNGSTHYITLEAVNLPSGQLAYKMVSHKIESTDGTRDVTERYSPEATIPGPAIVITEGDKVEITLQHGIATSSDPVSIHVHGVHFKIDSDGTVKALNGYTDEAAFPGKPYTYKWDAALGTAGTWPYHDHTFNDPMVGAEDKGLFGTLIVNPASGKTPALIDGQVTDVNVSDIKREFILWMHETTFWGMEVNHILDGKEIPLWTNPTVGAKLGETVRFHVLGMGTAFHTFHLHGHRWLSQGTTHVLDTVNIGPIVRETFVLKAGEGVGPGDWHYHCHVVQHMQSGMMGSFLVVQ